MTQRTHAALHGDATWFDGVQSQRQTAHLLLAQGLLRVVAGSDVLPRRYPLKDVHMSEPALDTPMAVNLPDGSTVWVEDAPLATGLHAAWRRAQARARGVRWPWPDVARLVRSWPAVMACLVDTLALLIWFDRQGASWAADRVVNVVPASVDRKIGDAAFKTVSQEWLAPSQVPLPRQQALRARFIDMAAKVEPDLVVMLHFHSEKAPERSERERDREIQRRAEAEANEPPDAQTKPRRREMPKGGFNAFALPNGAIVVLDGMTMSFTDDELMAVLGHELGHVVHRHGMRSVARSFGMLAVASVALGDFSSVVATAVASVQSFRYSREAEREADDYGRRFMKAAGVPPQAELSIWKKMLAVQEVAGVDELPAWMSAHPSTQERIDAAKAAAAR